MKKVLCLIDVLAFGGGAERQMIGLVQLLKQRGYTTDIAVYHDSPDLPEIKERFNLEPVVLSVKNNQLSKLMAVRRFIKQRGGYDCVIAYKGGPCIIGCLLKMTGQRFKLIVSERIVTQVLTRYNNIRFHLYRFADVIVPNSFAQGEFIAKEFPKLTTKIKVITNFTDTDYFSPNINQSHVDKINILTVGRITPQKNILNYLDAISLMTKKGVKDVLFHWVGSPQNSNDEQYAQQIQQIIKENELNDIVLFHPQTKDIIMHYQKCDIFCLPSSFEGFPNVVCEAMSCGKPIVCSRVCDNPSIVSEGENGLMFDPNNPEEISDIIQKMVTMSVEERLAWGKRSREMALEKFSRDAFVEKYIKLIEK